jgi:hypothetical protein
MKIQEKIMVKKRQLDDDEEEEEEEEDVTKCSSLCLMRHMAS